MWLQTFAHHVMFKRLEMKKNGDTLMNTEIGHFERCNVNGNHIQFIAFIDTFFFKLGAHMHSHKNINISFVNENCCIVYDNNNPI